MATYTGTCVGGPLDTKELAHSAKKKEFFSPAPSFVPAMGDAAPINAVMVGEYRLNDFGQWHWWETEKGAALRVLNG